MPNGLISELELTAARGDIHPAEFSLLMDKTVDMVRHLQKQMPNDPTVQSLIYYLSIASGRANRLSRNETTHLLLDAADALRILSEKLAYR
ncbi:MULTISPECIES: hypothetical protein [unclassified Rhizobium]|uniref:hypothetical protein n=1 Tax=unclassified Rhizobium TaxID=2613769 RepID=UPI00247AF84E|nr:MULTISPECIES: hypothetical protein [unclassified Rhizobium]MDH7801316.1 hypothetical protein [Rhizobium sp. AN70]